LTGNPKVLTGVGGFAMIVPVMPLASAIVRQAVRGLLCLLFVGGLLLPRAGWTQNAEALLATGEAGLISGNTGMAEQAFLRGMRTFPDDPRFAFYAGITAFRDGRGDAARARFEQISESFPQAHFYLGVLALDDDDPITAEQHLQAFLAQHSRDPQGELLLGYAQMLQGVPEADEHLNRAAQLDQNLRSFAFFYRGLSQFQRDARESADKALRAVGVLDEYPRLVELGQQTLDLMRRRGDAAKKRWIEAFVDFVFDDNITRELDRRGPEGEDLREDGVRNVVRGRYFEDFRTQSPKVTVGALLDLDIPVAFDTNTDVGLRTDPKTSLELRGFTDVGWYQALDRVSIDPGFESELGVALGPAEGDDFTFSGLRYTLRPRVYLFSDHERSLKLFYEASFRKDFDDDLRTALRQSVGVRPSWTGLNRRIYVSLLLAYRNQEAADARAFRWFGGEMSVDAQYNAPFGLILELQASYQKRFFREVRPTRDEDVFISHGGIGYKADNGFLAMVGVSQEHHRNSDPARRWRVRNYWLRLGGYL